MSDDRLDERVRKCLFLGYIQGEVGYQLWFLEFNSPIANGEVIFNESPIVFHRSDCGNIYTILDGAQLKVQLQP